MSYIIYGKKNYMNNIYSRKRYIAWKKKRKIKGQTNEQAWPICIEKVIGTSNVYLLADLFCRIKF